MSDLLHTFMFEHIAARGAIVQLEAAWQSMRALRRYPSIVESLLGESVVAAALLASTLKRDRGSLSIQMQGDGDLTLLLGECSNDYALRGTARWREGIGQAPLERLIGRGRCAITLRAEGDAGASYQGVVPIEGASLAQALEAYMERSEQLSTRLFLHAALDGCSGLLLQRTPARADRDPDDWNRLQHLAATVRPEEMRDCSAPELLRRLFPHDDLRLFSGRDLSFACSCSRERVRGMLAALGAEEVESVLNEQGKMEVACDFCGRAYTLSPEECRALFAKTAAG